MYTPMRPVSTQPTVNTRVYTGGAAPAQTIPQAPAVYAQPGTVQPSATATGLGSAINGVFNLIGKVFSGIINFFKRLFGGQSGAPAPAYVPGAPQSTVPATPAVPGAPTYPAVPAAPTLPANPAIPAAPGGALSAEEQQIAAQQGILATRENFDLFIKEAQGLEAANALGPGSTDVNSVKELQQVLASFGYPVQATGQWDQATTDAMLKFKKDNNLFSTYKMADGSPAVHPFVDDATKQVMLAKLQAAPAAPSPAAPTLPATPAPGPLATPTLPPVTSTPELPTLPPIETPTLPATPELPTVGSTPELPTLPPIETPTLPSIPTAPTPTVPATPAPPTTPTTPAGTLSAEEQQIAAQQGILATRENFDLFIKEAQGLEAANALGPGSTDTEMIKELQQVLASWGYTVQATGQWDQATTDAVLKFKKDSNLHSTYKMADGTAGVHPFIDDATKQAMIAKLQGAAPAPTPATPTVPATPTPATPTTPGTTQYQGATTLTAEEQQIATQQGILATRENFDAFMATARALEAAKALGPGSTEKDMITELQQVLKIWGYNVQQTGTWDQATTDAVLKFKRDNNLVSNYKMADGSAAIHPFIDETTKAKMIEKLGG